MKLLKVPPQKCDFFKFEEFEQLLRAAEAEPEFRAAILVAGEAGLRMGEILALRWEYVDPKAGKIVVMVNDWRGHIGSPKDGRERTIPLTARLAAALREHRHLRGKLVFCGQAGERWTKSIMRDGLWRACDRAGLRPIGWHPLRHSFCSHLAMRGAAPKAIQELAGHSNITITMRYMHLAPSALTEAIGLLENRAHPVTTNG